MQPGCIAVTGGSGFIGSALVDRLIADGNSVSVLTRQDAPSVTRPGIHFVKGDLNDPGFDPADFLDGAQCLFHCAGELRDEGMMEAVHIGGTGRLITAARHRVPVWVQLSSAGAYGPRYSGQVTESTTEAPTGCYERTKTEADRMVRDAARGGDFSVRIMRPANVIGEKMPNTSIRKMTEAVARGRFMFVGARGATVNYLAVENLVEALLVSSRPGGPNAETYNLADTCELSEFVSALSDGLGVPAPSRRLPLWLAFMIAYPGQYLPGFPLTPSRVRVLSGRVSYRSEKLSKEMGYRPVLAITEAARRIAVAWKAETALRSDRNV